MGTSRPGRRAARVAAVVVATLGAATFVPATAGGQSGGGTETVKLGMYTPIAGNPTGTSFPESKAAVQAAIRAHNKRGNGPRFALVFCDPMENPNDAADCARKFVDEGVVAMVGGFTSQGAQVSPILQDAGIADVGVNPINATDLTAPNSFPLDGGVLADYTALPFGLKAAGAKRLFVAALDIPGAALVVKFLQAGAKAAGIEFAGNVGVPSAAPDFAPFVAAATSKNADSVVLTLSEPDALQYILAAKQSGAKLRFAGSEGNMRPAALRKLGGAAEGAVTAHAFPPPTAAKRYRTLRQFVKEMTAEFKAGNEAADPKQATGPYSVRPWMAVHAVEQAIGSLPEGQPVTAAAVLEAMKTQTFDYGFGTPFDFTKPGPISVFPRVANPWVFFGKVKGDEIVPAGKKPLDIAEKVDFAEALT